VFFFCFSKNPKTTLSNFAAGTFGNFPVQSMEGTYGFEGLFLALF